MAGTAAAGEARYSIGEVLSLLRPEFGDVTISKIRFLESEGLVEPLRTPAGYRKYTPAHVDRLRLVLRAQRDRYLPLRVIREELREEPQGMGNLTAVASQPLTRAELAERSGLDEDAVTDLEQYGLVVPEPDGRYGAEALTVASIASRLSGYGLQGRHLRPYRTTADREVGLLAQIVPPLSKQGGQQRALETVHELAALCAQLHAALVRRGLRESLGA